MEKELKEYGLHIEHSEADDREPIDFEIRSDRTNELYATVWGSEPWNDVQVDCDHDYVEYDDDETVGECVLCGATCDWHYEGYADGFGEVYKQRVPHDWHTPEKIGGIIGRYIKELQKRW